jgi:hypothetical protein
LVRLAQAVTGLQSTMSTTNSLLNRDIYKFHSLLGKKLVILNDQSQNCLKYNGLKLLISDVPVRLKGTANLLDFNFNATVIMLSNGSLDEIDSDGSLTKKAIRIPITTVPKDKTDLLSFITNDELGGLLINELPYIHNWASKMDNNRILELLKQYPNAIPSLKQQPTTLSLKSRTDILSIWVAEHIVKGEGAFLGYVTKTTEASNLKAKTDGFLFYYYSVYFPIIF